MNTLKKYNFIERVDSMRDEFLDMYFKELSKEIDNPDFIKELKRELRRSKKENIEEIIKKYY